jgi:vacuole morphology and inheritance protein 14
VRQCLVDNDHARIKAIIEQLCHEYAYAVHQPHARNGGLIGLAAASIALGPVGALQKAVRRRKKLINRVK